MIAMLSMRRSWRGLVILAAIFLAFCAQAALPARAAIIYYDVSQPGVMPPSKEERSAQYLVINLNPLRNETVSVTGTTVNALNPTTTASTAAKPKTGNQTPVVPENCEPAMGALAKAADPDKAAARTAAISACKSEVQNIDLIVLDALKAFSGMTSDALTSRVSTDVELDLRTFLRTHQDFKDEKDVSTAAAVYDDWASQSARFSSAEADLALLRSPNLSDVKNVYSGRLGALQVYAATLNDPPLMGSITQTSADFKKLDDASITAVATTADQLENKLGLIRDDPTQLYVVVNAPCEKLGFSARNYTIKFLRGTNTVWEDDIVCYPEFSVGVMYYVDWLNTDSYTLQSTMVNGAAANVIVKQTNNNNQGSIAAAFHWCPWEGSWSPCGTFAASTNANGLDAFLGAGFLFGHRVIGVHGGVHVGQINVLTNGFSVGQVVPSGATFTRKQLSKNWFLGFTLNIPAH